MNPPDPQTPNPHNDTAPRICFARSAAAQTAGWFLPNITPQEPDESDGIPDLEPMPADRM